MAGFLPLTKQEMKERGIDQFDFICVTGDGYVDHPSFGIAIISRVLEAQGYTVGMIAQPHYHTLTDFERFGAPKYGFFVNAGFPRGTRLCRHGPPALCSAHQRRQHRLDGRPLYIRQKAAHGRCLFSRRKSRETAGPSGNRLL